MGAGLLVLALPVVKLAGWSPKIAGWLFVGVMTGAFVWAIARYVVSAGRRQRGAA